MKVFHSKEWSLNSDLHFVDSEEICPQWVGGYKPIPNNYKVVAIVDCDSLGEAFHLTNHIDTEWQSNNHVDAMASNARSTSVGDIIEDNDGKLWMVAGCGFEEVEWHKGSFKHYDNGREGHYLVHLTEKEEKMLKRHQDLVNEYAEYGNDDELLEVLVSAGKRNLLKRGIMI